MAIFEIEANGRTFEVDAPSMEAAISALKLGAAPQAAKQTGMLEDIGNQVGGVLKHAGRQVADYLNPFSEARHASYKKQAELPLGPAIAENLSQVAGTGAALHGVVDPVFGYAGQAIAPLVTVPGGRAWQAANAAAGIDLPKEVAQEQFGQALAGMRPGKTSPVGREMVQAPALSSRDLKAEAKSVYNDPQVRFTPVPRETITDVVTTTLNDFRGRGHHPDNSPSTKSVFKIMGEMDDVAATKPWSQNIDQLDRWSSRLGKIAEERQMTEGGPKPTPASQAATSLKRKIDDLMGAVSPEWRVADANYTAASAGDTLAFRNLRAENRANRSGTDGNLENTMRQEIGKIPDRGLTPQELALRDQISNGTQARDALRLIGKAGVDGGLSLLLNTGAALGTGGATIPYTIAATLSRKVGEGMTRGQIRKLDQMIRGRAPASRKQGPVVKPATTTEKLIAALLGNRSAHYGVVPSYAQQNQP